MVYPKVGNVLVEQKVLEVMEKAKDGAITPHELAKELGIGFGTARAVLMNMALAGKVKQLFTVNGYLYKLTKKEGSVNEAGCNS